MSNVNIANKERALFLKQLAKDPNQNIDTLANVFNIPADRAWVYVKTFISDVAKYPQNGYIHLQTILNDNLETGYRVEDHEVKKLVPLLEKYGDLGLIDTHRENLTPPQQPTQQTPQQLNTSGIANDLNTSTIAHETVQVQHQQGQPQPEESPVYDYSKYQIDTLNKGYDYSFMGDLNRIGLLRWVLRGVPNPAPPQKIEGFVRYFELNQDYLMSSPEALNAEFKSYFSENIALNASKAFNTYIRNLKPQFQFGVKLSEAGLRQGYGPNDPSMMFTRGMHGNQYEDPFNTSWHHEGILPYDMNVNSAEAKRLIYDAQQAKRRQKELDEQQKRLMEDARTNMQLQMTRFLDPKVMTGMGAGGQNMDTIFMPLVMAGKAQPITYFDPQDNTQKIRYEMIPQSQQQQQNGMAGISDPNQLTAKDMMEMQIRMFELLDRKRDENTTLRDQMFNQVLELFKQKASPVNEFFEFTKIYKELVPQSGSQFGNTIEAARVMLEHEKFKGDQARADKLLDRQYESKTKIQELEFEKEKEANEMRKTLITSVSQMLASNLPTFFQLLLILTGRGQQAGQLAPAGAAAGPLGAIGNLFGSMFGGGGGNGGSGGPLGGLGKLFGLGGGGGASNEGGTEGSEEEAPTSFSDIFAGLGKMGGGGAAAPSQQQAQPQQGGSPDFGSMLSGILGGMGQPQPTQQAPQGQTYVPSTEQFMSGAGGFGQQYPPSQQQAARVQPNFDAMAANQERLYSQRNKIGTTTSVGVGNSMYDDLSGGGVVAGSASNNPEMAEVNNQSVEQSQPPPNYQIPSRAEIEQGPINGEQLVSRVQSSYQQPAEPVQQQQQQEEDPYPIYTPEKFQGLTKEQIAQRLEEAKRSKQSIDSFLSSAEAVYNQKQ